MWLAFMPMSSLDFDLTLPHFSVVTRDWLNAGVFISICAIFIYIARTKLQPLALIGILAVGLTSELLVAKNSMPVQPAFEYEQTELLQDLERKQSRIACVGAHLLKPNTNIIYGINQVSSSNPIFPKRYLPLLNAFGCKMDEFNQTFSFNLSPLLNLASVGEIVSQTPVKSYTTTAYPSTMKSVVEFTYGLRLNQVDYRSDPESGIFGKLAWTVDHRINARYNYFMVLLDEHEKLIWFGDQTPLTDQSDCCEFAVPLPPLSGGTAKLGLSVFDTKIGKPIKPLSGSSIDTTIALGDITQTSDAQALAPVQPFTLSRTYDRGIRVYQNRNALPAAYLVGSATQVASADEALRAIQRPDFQPKTQVIIESTNSLPGSTNLSSAQAPHQLYAYLPNVSLTRPNATTVIAQCTTSAPAWLVLTDIFYPGWSVTTDGIACRIEKANYCFRAVHIQAGKHTVKFTYQPLSFLFGICLSAISIFVISIYCASDFRSKRKRLT